jgi:hypothetical protein
MKTTTRIMLSVAAAALGVGAADAVVITQTINFAGATDLGNVTGVNSTALGSYNGQSYFAFFDSAWGTLDSITIASTYAINSNITVTKIGDSALSGSVRTESGAQFNSSNTTMDGLFNTYLNKNTDGVQLGTGSLDQVAYDLKTAVNTFTDSAQFNGLTKSGTTSDSVLASDIAYFVVSGGGSFTPLLKTLTSTLLSTTGGNATSSQTTQATSSITLTYIYTAAPAPSAVPEPATWGMMVLGFGAMGLAMRRRQRTSVHFG